MDYLKEFVIPISGLKEKVYQYDFEIDNKFFDAFETSEIRKGNLKIEVELDKKSTMIILNFVIKGKVNIMCDRCLDYFDFPVDDKEMLIVKFGDEQMDDNDEIMVIPHNSHQLDISNFLFEIIHLMLPIQRIHPEDGEQQCDPEVIAKLNELTRHETIDPRWEGLKGLINE